MDARRRKLLIQAVDFLPARPNPSGLQILREARL